jgi:hypothetical protein
MTFSFEILSNLSSTEPPSIDIQSVMQRALQYEHTKSCCQLYLSSLVCLFSLFMCYNIHLCKCVILMQLAQIQIFLCTAGFKLNVTKKECSLHFVWGCSSVMCCHATGWFLLNILRQDGDLIFKGWNFSGCCLNDNGLFQPIKVRPQHCL